MTGETKDGLFWFVVWFASLISLSNLARQVWS